MVIIRRFMKNAIIIAVISATVITVGCSKKPNAVAVSDGSNTWFLGATTINGTNASATNVTIRVRTREVSK